MGALEHWSEFNVAIVGAAGALAGLLIVALSVNIAQIVASRQLVLRAATSIAGLLMAVVACAIGLIPDQPAWAYGLEIVAVGALAGIFGVRAIGPIMAKDPGVPGPLVRTVKALIGVLPAAFAITGGLSVLTGAVPLGLALVAVSALLAIVLGVVIAWVALVEVLR
jgi:hypothetical protein